MIAWLVVKKKKITWPPGSVSRTDRSPHRTYESCWLASKVSGLEFQAQRRSQSILDNGKGLQSNAQAAKPGRLQRNDGSFSTRCESEELEPKHQRERGRRQQRIEEIGIKPGSSSPACRAVCTPSLPCAKEPAHGSARARRGTASWGVGV
jgi:hypothetical protein